MPRDDAGGTDALTVLRAHDGKRLTKRFTVASNGAVAVRTYDKPTWFAAERVPVAGIHDLHRLLLALERDPHACIIRGEAGPGADMARTDRKKVENGGHFAEVPRRWAMLDIDGVPQPPGCSVLADPEDAARALLDRLAADAPELEGVTAVVQFSGSAGLDEVAAGELEAAEETGARRRDWSGVAKPGFRAHVWVWLRRPLGEAELKRWRERVEAAGLKLDEATLRTVQPHYCAAPVFEAPLRDPLAGRRTVLVRGAEDAADLDVPEPQARTHSATTGHSAHAGRGYLGHLEAIGPGGFHPRIVSAVGAYVAANWPTPDPEALKADLRGRIFAADPGGRTPAEIADRASDRHLDDIIAWAMARERDKRAAPPPPAPEVAPTFPDQGVPLGVAQARMGEALAGYAARLRGGAALDLLLRVTVGGGKSNEAIRAAPAILDAAREAKPDGALYYLTPRHDLNEELRERFAKARPGLRVRIFRGMDQEDPERPGDRMCLDPELVRAAAEAGLPHTTPCGACPLRGECGHRRQTREGADVWLGAHQLAHAQKLGALPDAAAVVVDESFHGAAMTGLDPLHPVEMPLSDLRDDRTGAVTGLDRLHLIFLRRLVLRVLERHGEGGLLREAFAAEGLEASGAKEWMDLEWRTKPEVKLAGDATRDGILDRLREARGAGFRRLRPVLARYVRELLEGDAARSVNVGVAPGGAAVRFAWREDFAKWAKEAPKLFLDATTHPDLVRVWSPAVETVEVEVSAPHQHVRQVLREFGRRFFVGNPENVRRLADLVVVELARTDGDVLVVAQKAVVDLLRKALLDEERPRFAGGELPERLHLAHHGAVTGLNRWDKVDRALIVGRPAVNRRQGERLAEVLKGAPVAVVADREDDHWPNVTAGLRMADGSGRPVRQPRHPDPLVEALRWSISEGAVLQAIGRARGVRRGPDRPVVVTVLDAMALPMAVHEEAAWEEVRPDRLEVAAAEAALNGRALPLAPADLHTARRDLWDTPKAAKRELEKREGGFVSDFESPQALIKGPYKALGAFKKCNDFGQLPARYRKGLRGRWSLALVPPERGRAALVEAVGPVAAYEVEGSPPPPPDPPSAGPPAPPAPDPGGAAGSRGGGHRPGAGVPRAAWSADAALARLAGTIPPMAHGPPQGPPRPTAH